MPQFKLLKLPTLAREHVFLLMTPTTTFNMYLTSAKIQKMLHEIRKQRQSIQSVVLTCGHRTHMFHFEFTENSEKYQWKMENELQSFEDFFRGVPCPLMSHRNVCDNTVMTSSHYNHYLAVEEIMKIFWDIFPIPEDLQIVFKTKNFAYGRRFCWSFEKVKKLEVDGECVSAETLNIVVNEVAKNFDHFVMSAKVFYEFQSFKIFQCPNLSISNAEWLSPAHILQFSSQFATVRGSKLGTDDFLKFVEKWLESDDKTMHVARFLENEKKLDENGILFELNTKTWNPKTRDADFCVSDGETKLEVKCENGWDVERSDGMLATLLITETSFQFLIWHDKFPSRSHQNLK